MRGGLRVRCVCCGVGRFGGFEEWDRGFVGGFLCG